MMRHRLRPLRPTLTALLMLVAMAGAAGVFDGTSTPSGDFPLEDARKAYQLGDYANAYRLLNLGVKCRKTLPRRRDN